MPSLVAATPQDRTRSPEDHSSHYRTAWASTATSTFPRSRSWRGTPSPSPPPPASPSPLTTSNPWATSRCAHEYRDVRLFNYTTITTTKLYNCVNAQMARQVTESYIGVVASYVGHHLDLYMPPFAVFTSSRVLQPLTNRYCRPYLPATNTVFMCAVDQLPALCASY